MYLPCYLVLLGLSLAVGGRHICLDEVQRIAHGDEGSPLGETQHGQSVLSAKSPQTDELTVLSEPVSNEKDLVDKVESKLMTKYPSEMNVSQTLPNVTGVLQNRHYLSWGEIKMIDVEFPLLKTCRPKLSKVKGLGKGIYCKDQPECS